MILLLKNEPNIFCAKKTNNHKFKNGAIVSGCFVRYNTMLPFFMVVNIDFLISLSEFRYLIFWWHT